MSALIFANCDYSALELRTLAQVCIFLFGRSRLAEVLNAGEDPHLTMAAAMLGMSYAEAVAIYANPDHPLYHKLDDARQTGKVANFGFGGGLGAEKLCLFARKTYKVTLTIAQAKQLKATWFETFPEMRQYFAYVNSLMGPSGATFRHFVSGRMRGGAAYTETCNSFFQALGADANGASLFDISESCYVPTACQWCAGSCNGCVWCKPGIPGVSPMYGSRLVNHVHDDDITECAEPRGHEVAHTLSKLMIDGVRGHLPDVPALAKPFLSYYWSKDTRQVWIPDSNSAIKDENGKGKRLLAWPQKLAA